MTILLDGEPCDDCDIGISMFFCYDGVRRCRNCIHALAAANGWDRVPDPPDPTPVPAPPTEPLLSPAERRAMRMEKRLRDQRQGKML